MNPTGETLPLKPNQSEAGSNVVEFIRRPRDAAAPKAGAASAHRAGTHTSAPDDDDPGPSAA